MKCIANKGAFLLLNHIIPCRRSRHAAAIAEQFIEFTAQKNSGKRFIRAAQKHRRNERHRRREIVIGIVGAYWKRRKRLACYQSASIAAEMRNSTHARLTSSGAHQIANRQISRESHANAMSALRIRSLAARNKLSGESSYANIISNGSESHHLVKPPLASRKSKKHAHRSSDVSNAAPSIACGSLRRCSGRGEAAAKGIAARPHRRFDISPPPTQPSIAQSLILKCARR